MKHHSFRQLIASAVSVFSIFLLLALMLSIPGPIYDAIVSIDHSVETLIAPFRAFPELVRFMALVTYLGNPEIIIALEIALIAFILLVHRKRIAALFLGGIVVGEIFSWLFKNLLARVRPDEIFRVSRHGFSFPSGHALLAMVFYGCLGFFAMHLVRKQWQKRLIGIVTGIIIFLIGTSRVFLGVHWASDVIGGWMLGLACLLGVIILFHHIHDHKAHENLRTLSRKEMTAVLVVTLMVGFFVVYYFVTQIGQIRSIV
jgi:undecaprenyl-diphosphatase